MRRGRVDHHSSPSNKRCQAQIGCKRNMSRSGAMGAAVVACATRIGSAEWGGASAPGWERSLTGLTDERCNVAAAASEFDSELELEATTAEDEAAVFLCAEMSPTAARPRINKI